MCLYVVTPCISMIYMNSAPFAAPNGGEESVRPATDGKGLDPPFPPVEEPPRGASGTP